VSICGFMSNLIWCPTPPFPFPTYHPRAGTRFPTMPEPTSDNIHSKPTARCLRILATLACGVFVAQSVRHRLEPDGLCFMLSLVLRRYLPLLLRLSPGILQRRSLLPSRPTPVQDLLESSEHHLVEVLRGQHVYVVTEGLRFR
jgi:hypothetical protein